MCIDELARHVESAWAREGNVKSQFSEIAWRQLCCPLPASFNFENLAAAICDGLELPPQRRDDEGFGQPGVTLYHGRRFLIEALCWHSGTPAVHQHSFAGAFRIITGRSFHTRYAFAPRSQIENIAVGKLHLLGSELLKAGDAVEIPTGSSLIHSAFHLDSPSMTLVVRTHQNSAPELTYLPPGIAYDTAARSPRLHKALQILDTLSQTHHSSYHESVRALVKRENVYGGMAAIMRQGSNRVQESVFEEFLALYLSVHGVRVQPIISAMREERRRTAIMRLRSSVVDPEMRFFLAALLNLECREDILASLRQLRPDDTSAREFAARAAACLVSSSNDTQVIAVAACRGLIEDIPSRRFPAWAASSWKRPINKMERSHLKSFYDGVCSHRLLAPLAQSRSGGPRGRAGKSHTP